LSYECVTFLFLWGSYPFSRLSLWRLPIFLYSSVDFGLIFGGVKFNGWKAWFPFFSSSFSISSLGFVSVSVRLCSLFPPSDDLVASSPVF
jgi:hypothetical protein